jgi:hypothetical protein
LPVTIADVLVAPPQQLAALAAPPQQLAWAPVSTLLAAAAYFSRTVSRMASDDGALMVVSLRNVTRRLLS